MNNTLKLTVLLVCFASTAIAEKIPIVIKCAIGKGSNAFSYPEVLVYQNRQATIRASREFHFPSKWDLPSKSINSEGKNIIIPITPLEFEQVDSGWTINCEAESIEGGLIRLTGSVTFTEPELKQAVHGEQSGPIYTSSPKKTLLTENKGESAVIHSSSTYFQVFALPGKPYKFKVARLNKTIPFQITCNFKKKTANKPMD